ncbi:hypothetical protein HDU98_004896 [Podochytrium sp. JEL0797]|nr:hypothetical protein HDU98_004896 [Podochytrium sp. JEL0797]
MLYNVPSNHSRLLTIYASLLLYIYPRARFRESLEHSDIPAHLSHHFACSLTASTSFGSFLIDARYLCKVFSQIEFLRIPPPFHVAALTSLITSCQAQKQFHALMNHALEEVEVLRRERVHATVRTKELKLAISRGESEVANAGVLVGKLESLVGDVTCLLESGRTKAEADNNVPPRTLPIDQRLQHERTLHENTNTLENYRTAHTSHTDQLALLVSELTAVESRSIQVNHDLAKKKNQLRLGGSRVLGYDRNGAVYFWVDVGVSGEQAFEVPEIAVEVVGTPVAPVVRGKGGSRNGSVAGSATGSEKGEANGNVKAMEVDGNEVGEKKADGEVKPIEPEATPATKQVEILPTYRIAGIVVDSSYALKPSDTDTSTSPQQYENPRSFGPFTFIDSMPLLKSFVRSLSDRGNRERDLQSTLREQFEISYGITFPTLKRAWDAYEAAPLTPAEVNLDAGFKGLSAWISTLGQSLVVGGGSAATSPESSMPSTPVNASTESLTSVTSAIGLRTRRAKPAKALMAHERMTMFERSSIALVKSRLHELMPLTGTIPKSDGATPKKEKTACDAIRTLAAAREVATSIISRKFGRNTVNELEDRLERCETWSMMCVLLGDVIRETKSRRLNDWLDETRDGGWVEEEEETTEADESSKGRGLDKPKLTRKPRKVAKQPEVEIWK